MNILSDKLDFNEAWAYLLSLIGRSRAIYYLYRIVAKVEYVSLV